MDQFPVENFSRYLPIEEDALRWGMHVLDAGSTQIPANSPYPPGQHPDPYIFSWDKGRTLEEYQLVYITHGGGLFETEETGQIRIQAGHVFMLFPNVWHRYRPTISTGWDECWIGFGGKTATRIMETFFSKEKAVMMIGHDEQLEDLIHSVAELPIEGRAGFQQIMAARTMEALALVISLSKSYHATDQEAARKIQQARYYLMHHSPEEVDMNQLARKLGLSYSRFRSLFREHTGSAPHQYLLGIRMNKARDMLRHTKMPIGEIADHVGFASPYYFSRLFRIKHECSPSEYRTRRQ